MPQFQHSRHFNPLRDGLLSRVDNGQFGNRPLIGWPQMAENVGDIDVPAIVRQSHIVRRAPRRQPLQLEPCGKVYNGNVVADAVCNVQRFSSTIGCQTDWTPTSRQRSPHLEGGCVNLGDGITPFV